MAIDPSTLEYQYRRVAGGDSNNQKATYGVEFSTNGQDYTFIPDSVINTGVNTGENTYVMPWFLNKENLGTLGQVGQKVDLAGKSWYGDYLKDTVGASTTGFLVPSGSINFDAKMNTFPTSEGEVKGIAERSGQLVYTQATDGGRVKFLSEDGTKHTITPGRSWLGETFGDIGDSASDFINSDVGKLALVVAAAYAGGAFDPSSAAATGGEVAAGEAVGGAGSTGGLLTNAALDSQFIAADAAQLASQGLSSGQIAQTLTASGVDSFIAADAAQLAAQGLGATQIASTLNATVPTSTAATGAGGLFTGTAATGAAAGGAAAGGAALGGLGNAALIQGGLQLAGGLLGSQTAIDAQREQAAQQAALAEKVSAMGKFQPVGTTTRFGTSSFVTDPVTGAITPSYSLSPEAQAYQTSLSALGTQGLAAGQGLMNLGQQYVGESPEAVRQRYIETQRAVLAPEQEQQLARLRNNQFQTGRTGVATGATTAGGLAATNPEMAAYYNALANTERQLAANAETQYQNQVNFGTGLLGSATTPFSNVFNAQKNVEAAGQQPLELSTNFANTVATRGAAQGANYAAAMNPSINNTAAANSVNPFATTLQGAGSNPLLGYGLQKLFS
jgi:hypothetical protein